ARRFPQRVFVVVTPTPTDAERWLADARALAGDAAALYPQREALGAEEPHVEIAGERIETLEALLSGRVRMLVTTARAAAERTAVPAALESMRLVLQVGPGSLTEVVRRLGAMAYDRVPTVTEVAQFSVRGGILDVYGFGMAAPTRVEWSGDDIVSLRPFDLDSQRAGEPIERVTVLPVSTEAITTSVGAHAASQQRHSLLTLLPTDALLVLAGESAPEQEVDRAWAEAEHHLEIARRLGEAPPARAEIFVAPEQWRRALQPLPRVAPAAPRGAGRFPRAAPAAAGPRRQERRRPAAQAAPPRRHDVAASAGQGSRRHPPHGRRVARLVRPPPARDRIRVPARHGVAARARVGLPVRGHARPASCLRGGKTGHGARPTDGPVTGRRRRIRQDRGRAAGGLQSGAGGEAGGGARAHHDPRRAARPHLPRAAGRLSRAHRGAVAVPWPGRHAARRPGSGAGRSGPGDRYPPAAVARRALSRPGPADRGRGASVRRAAQGA